MADIVSFVITLVFAIFGLSNLCFIRAQKVGGFSVELIHRDSPKSPLYNHLDTKYTRVTNALRRSFNRAHRLKPTYASIMSAEADVISDSGEYLMNISIGTPPFHVVATADTGGDFIWTQCKPCSQCSELKAPLFDPTTSSTYKTFTCGASQCANRIGTTCSTDNTCQYGISTGNESSSHGELAADTFTLDSTTGLGSPVVVPNVVFGCGHDNVGDFDESSSGVIGLGQGSTSLISQLGTTIAGKFSYCLLPLSEAGNSSKMSFGSEAVVSGEGTVSNPMTSLPFLPTFYAITMYAISVGTNRINYTDTPYGTHEGNIVIDSGTTLTLLPEDYYAELESAVHRVINAKRVRGPEGFSLCYDATNSFVAPDITVHFSGGDVKLQPLNIFVLVSDTVSCFTFGPIELSAIYGNLAQVNFLVGYDIVKQTVSFKPTDCSKN